MRGGRSGVSITRDLRENGVTWSNRHLPEKRKSVCVCRVFVSVCGCVCEFD